MRLSKFVLGTVALSFAVLLAILIRADLHLMTGDTFTATRGLASANNALGSFDTLVATTTPRGGDTATWTLSNPSFTGTIMQVEFAIRMQTISGGFSNDVVAIQYSNDSGTTWFNAETDIVVPGTLTTYGNYTVTTSFPTMATLDNAMVRISYTQNAGPDNPTIGLDAVEMYVTYEPPPRVNLTYPLNYTWRNTTTIGFNYTPYSLISYSSCDLYINSTFNATNQSAILNATNNTIFGSGFTDGDFLWNVSCTDASGFNGTSSVAWIVRVDLTTPIVTLVAPPNGSESVTSRNNFVFNVTDAASINSCALVVNDMQENITTSPARGTDITMAASLTNGDYRWYVNCTDENGWTGQSEIWDISVRIPNITAERPSYFLGENASLIGFNWISGAYVTVNITLANGTNETFNASVNSSRMINVTQVLGVNYPRGVYNVYAIQQNDSTRNATTSFFVPALPVIHTVNVSPGAVVLNAGTTKLVLCNFTVSDEDGAGDITGANITLYTAPSTSASAASNVSKYDNSSCAETGSTATSRSYSCSIELQYYAVNGTWSCNATGISDAVRSNVTNFTVDPLYALSVSDDILSFGELTGGEVSANLPESITNLGNQRINVTALGYGGFIGDGNSFNCVNTNISVGAMKFAPNNTATYAEKENLTSTFTSLGLFVNSQVDPTVVTNTSYWQLQVPDGDFENEQCNGTIVFQAEG